MCDTSRSANEKIQGKDKFCRALSTEEHINLGRTLSFCALRHVLMVEAAGWERRDKRKPLIYPIL